MALADPNELWPKLDALGEDEVRKRVAQGAYGPNKRPLVDEWLLERQRQGEASRAQSEDAHRDREHKATERSLRTGRIANSLSALSLAISVGALIFAGLAYVGTQRESLTLQLNRSTADYSARFSPFATPLGVVLMDSWWECLLANTGDRTVSIVSMEVWSLRQGSAVQWSGMMGKVLNADGTPLSLPFSIQPGYSIKMLVQLRVPIDSATLKILGSPARLPSVAGAERKLVRLRRDLWGNPASPIMRGDSVLGFTVSETSRQPIFVVSFATAKGKSVASGAPWYPGANLIASSQR